MVSYAQLAIPINARLDANPGSDRYLPEQDIIPGINSATARLQSALGWGLANRKAPEEALRDFITTAIYQTDAYGSILLDDPLMPWTVANIVAVYTNPDLQVPGTVNPLPDNQSQYRGDLLWAGPGENGAVQRVTQEQVPLIRRNASMRGNEVLANNPDRVSYSYYESSGRVWVLPKSVMGKKIIAVAQIEQFAPMTDTNSTVNVPQSMIQLLSSWALEYISWKQDPTGMGVGAFASKDAAQLFGFTVN